MLAADCASDVRCSEAAASAEEGGWTRPGHTFNRATPENRAPRPARQAGETRTPHADRLFRPDAAATGPARPNKYNAELLARERGRLVERSEASRRRRRGAPQALAGCVCVRRSRARRAAQRAWATWARSCPRESGQRYASFSSYIGKIHQRCIALGRVYPPWTGAGKAMS